MINIEKLKQEHTMIIKELNEDNFYLFAAASYVNPQCPTQEELDNDISRLASLNILFRRYKNTKSINERLVLNHLIVLHNVFGVAPGNKIVFYKVEKEYHSYLKTCLIFLNLLNQEESFKEVPVDLGIFKLIREI